MNQWTRRNIDKLVFAVAVIAIAGFSFGARSNDGPAALPPEGHLDTNTQKDGGTAMFTVTKPQGKVHNANCGNMAFRMHPRLSPAVHPAASESERCG